MVASTIPQGFLGNLSPPQELALKQMWALFLAVSDDGADAWCLNPRTAPNRASGVELFDAKKTIRHVGTDKFCKAFWRSPLSEHPDTILLRFLRARKWDVYKAFAMFARMLKYRVDYEVDKIIDCGEPVLNKHIPGFLSQLQSGKTYLHGTDLTGRPVVYIHVAKHDMKTSWIAMRTFVIYCMETLRLFHTPPDYQITLVFDMAGFNPLKHADLKQLQWLVHAFEAFYPETLGLLLIHRAPRVFLPLWKVAIAPLLEPVVRTKIRWTWSAKDLFEFIEPTHVPVSMGGEDDWSWRYVDVVEGENWRVEDREARRQWTGKRAMARKALVECTRSWVRGVLEVAEDTALVSEKETKNTGSKTKRATASLKQHVRIPSAEEPELAQILRRRKQALLAYRIVSIEADPYLRPRSVYHRQGSLLEDGTAKWVYRKRIASPSTGAAVPTSPSTLKLNPFKRSAKPKDDGSGVVKEAERWETQTQKTGVPVSSLRRMLDADRAPVQDREEAEAAAEFYKRHRGSGNFLDSTISSSVAPSAFRLSYHPGTGGTTMSALSSPTQSTFSTAFSAVGSANQAGGLPALPPSSSVRQGRPRPSTSTGLPARTLSVDPPLRRSSLLVPPEVSNILASLSSSRSRCASPSPSVTSSLQHPRPPFARARSSPNTGAESPFRLSALSLFGGGEGGDGALTPLGSASCYSSVSNLRLEESPSEVDAPMHFPHPLSLSSSAGVSPSSPKSPVSAPPTTTSTPPSSFGRLAKSATPRASAPSLRTSASFKSTSNKTADSRPLTSPSATTTAFGGGGGAKFRFGHARPGSSGSGPSPSLHWPAPGAGEKKGDEKEDVAEPNESVLCVEDELDVDRETDSSEVDGTSSVLSEKTVSAAPAPVPTPPVPATPTSAPTPVTSASPGPAIPPRSPMRGTLGRASSPIMQQNKERAPNPMALVAAFQASPASEARTRSGSIASSHSSSSDSAYSTDSPASAEPATPPSPASVVSSDPAQQKQAEQGQKPQKREGKGHPSKELSLSTATSSIRSTASSVSALRLEDFVQPPLPPSTTTTSSSRPLIRPRSPFRTTCVRPPSVSRYHWNSSREEVFHDAVEAPESEVDDNDAELRDETVVSDASTGTANTFGARQALPFLSRKLKDSDSISATHAFSVRSS